MMETPCPEDNREGGFEEKNRSRSSRDSPPSPATPHPLSIPGMKYIMHKFARSQYPSPTVLSSQSSTAITLGSVGWNIRLSIL
jgi:hypothetical protein